MARSQLLLNWLALFAVLVVLNPSPTLGEEGLSGPVRNPEDAAAIAFHYSGFAKHVLYTKLADDHIQLTRLIDTTTPFLHRFSTGEAVWRVQFDGVHLEGIPGDDSGTTNVQSFTVFVDSLTGHLLKIEGVFAPFDSTITPMLTAQKAEAQIEGGGERYLEIPEEPPIHSFMAAADACPTRISQARRVVAQYILYSHGFGKRTDTELRFTEPKLCWVILLEGIPPIEPRGGNADWLPVYTRNRIRQVVNSTTGRVWITSTRPGLGISDADKQWIFPDRY